ncbi:hypothetical protein NZK32_13330 [Cyanobium sp. FGCU-52]|nr:hypothetical protein [Cyanobium sp. FGCU52]
MTPLPDRIVILGLVLAVGICFALAAWTARLAPAPDPPLQWRSPEALPATPSRGGAVI